MKTTLKSTTLALAAIILFSTSSHAVGLKEKAIEKAKEAIENAAPDDWMLLASQASYLIQKIQVCSQLKSGLKSH